MNVEFEMMRPAVGLLDRHFVLGDIFNREVYLGLQTMYRTWHVKIPSSNMGRREIGCKIGFRYGQITGSWVLIVNGEVKALRKGRMSEGIFDLMFKISEQVFTITAERVKGVKYRLKLRMNGYEMMEIRKTTEIAVGETTPSRITIPDIRRCEVMGKVVIMYKICSEINSQERVMVERRYSDFEMLTNMICGQTSSHLKPTLPKLPGKILNPFVDQSKAAIVAERQQNLQRFLIALLANQKVRVCLCMCMCMCTCG